MKFAIDYLAGAKYPKTLIEAHPDGFGAGFFTYVDGFGGSLSTASKLLSSGKCPFIRFQLWWRDDHDFSNSESDILRQAKKVKRKIALKYPDLKFEVSPACEHKFKRAEADKLCKKVSEIFKGCKNVRVINCPWIGGGGELSRKYKNEVHRADNRVPGGKYNFSYDGIACVDKDVTADLRRWKRARWFFFWTYQLNLKRNEDDKTQRKNRKVRPTRELIESLAFLATKKGSTQISKNWLAKSHAEQTNDKPTDRENRLLIIAPIKSSHCELVDSNGYVVARASYYAPYENDRYRYYFRKWGYQLAKFGLLGVYINGKKYGTINPGFREGSFR